LLEGQVDVDRELEINDGSTISEEALVEKSDADGTPAGMRFSGSAATAAVDMGPDGWIVTELGGEVANKGASEHRTAAILVRALRQAGGDWGEPEGKRDDEREEGVDCYVRTRADGASIPKDRDWLRIQVTTPEREAWRDIVTTGAAKDSSAVADLVGELVAAIEKKKTRADPTVILALDATHAAQYTFRSVVDSFRAGYSPSSDGRNFAAIWLVGPMAHLVFRLDA
jgi:hypothetical protein